MIVPQPSQDKNFLEHLSPLVPDQILKFRDEVDDSLLKESGSSSSCDEYISSEKIKPIRVEEKIHVSQYGKQIIWEKYESIVVD